MSFPKYPKYKASGVEWLGDVPEHWAVTRLKNLSSRISSGETPLGGSEVYVSQGVTFLRSQNVYDEGLRLDDVVFITEAVDEAMAVSRVVPDDILLNITGASIGRSCVVPRDLQNANVNQHVCVIRLKKSSHVPFAGWLFKSATVKGQIDEAQNGAAREGLNFVQIGQMSIPLPPAEEQQRIAAFLDSETARIDALIAEQRRLIELLKEKRQAVISHAVTKGLNPNAPMKPSGIDWLGDVPEHWEVKSLRRVGQVQNGLNIGGEAFGSGDPFVSYGDVYNNPNVPVPPSGLVQSTIHDQVKCSLEVGDILFTRTSETTDDIGIASTCLSTMPHTTFAGFLIRLRPIEGVLAPNYSTYLFRNQGVQLHFAGTMNLVTRASLSQDLLKELPICIPPLEEQRGIAAYINEQVEAFSQLQAEAERAIELLHERRTALISAAVTGKIDVRQFANVEAA